MRFYLHSFLFNSTQSGMTSGTAKKIKLTQVSVTVHSSDCGFIDSDFK